MQINLIYDSPLRSLTCSGGPTFEPPTKHSFSLQFSLKHSALFSLDLVLTINPRDAVSRDDHLKKNANHHLATEEGPKCLEMN